MAATDIFHIPWNEWFDGNGAPLAGGKLYFYLYGTDTLATTYSNPGLTVEHANPVVADTAGVWAEIFLDPTVTYKVVLKTSADVTIKTALEVVSGGTGGATGAFTATYGAGGDYETLDAAVQEFASRSYAADATVTLTGLSGTVTTLSGNIATVPPGLAERLTITGAATTDVAITGVYSRTGDAGNYSVTYSATSVAGMTVGNFVHIRSLVGTNNGLRWGFVGTDVELGVGLGLGALFLSSTALTFQAAPAGLLTTDDAILVGPQLLALTAVSSSPSLTATTSAAGQPDISFGHSYWWALRRQSGKTVSTSGSSTTITGSAGTTFTTTAETGALIIGHGWARRIVSVTNDLNIVVDRAINLSSQHFVIRPAIYLHQGGYEVTAVDSVNNRFTVKNTTLQAATYAPPPLIGLASATATVVKTVLKQSGSGDGIVVTGSAHLKSLTKVAIIGPDGTSVDSGIGLNLTGETEKEAGSFSDGQSVIISGWGIGLSSYGGSSNTDDEDGDGMAISTNYINVSVYGGGFINLDHASITAWTLYGFFVSQGRIEYGASVFAGGGGIACYFASNGDGHTDLTIWEHCGTSTSAYCLFVEGGGYSHSCPGWFFGGKGNHVYMGKRAGGRISGMLSICAGRTALLTEDADVEAVTSSIIGSTLAAVQLSRTRANLQYLGAGGNGSTLVVVGGGDVNLISAVLRDGGESNLLGTDGANIVATSSYSRGAQSGYDYASIGPGTILNAASYAYASSTFSITGGSEIQTFASSGTSTKPTWASTAEIFLCGGGGGGGSGRRGAAGGVRCGGGGGGGGGITRISLPASILSATIAVTIGAGGAGGTNQTVNDTNGLPGSTGGDTTFGAYVKAFGGVGGSGGTNATGTAGAGGSGVHSGGAGGSASTTGLIGVNGTGVGYAAGGGASGGGLTSGDAQSNGGAGGSYAFAFGTNNATAGTAPSGNGGAGATPQSTLSGVVIGGGGGGGGASGAAAVGGDGGPGGLCGGGGGGGGASVNGSNSGAGGVGATGYAVIIWR